MYRLCLISLYIHFTSSGDTFNGLLYEPDQLPKFETSLKKPEELSECPSTLCLSSANLIWLALGLIILLVLMSCISFLIYKRRVLSGDADESLNTQANYVRSIHCDSDLLNASTAQLTDDMLIEKSHRGHTNNCQTAAGIGNAHNMKHAQVGLKGSMNSNLMTTDERMLDIPESSTFWENKFDTDICMVNVNADCTTLSRSVECRLCHQQFSPYSVRASLHAKHLQPAVIRPPEKIDYQSAVQSYDFKSLPRQMQFPDARTESQNDKDNRNKNAETLSTVLNTQSTMPYKTVIENDRSNYDCSFDGNKQMILNNKNHAATLTFENYTVKL